MSLKNSIYIGTSGWSYKHWQEIFYPNNIVEKEHLAYYAKHFSTVEINNSFYHLLTQKVVENWINSTPADFVFAVKASRYITHIKRLKEPEKMLATFMESIKPFNDKIGPILFQLPPKFNINPERLEYFLKLLPNNYQYAFEFRDKSWFNPEIYGLLKKYNIALCIYNMGDYQSPKEITADFVYIRMHGPGGIGTNKYDNKNLETLVQEIKNYNNKNKKVFCYFNNDEAGFAIENAHSLLLKLHNTKLP